MPKNRATKIGLVRAADMLKAVCRGSDSTSVAPGVANRAPAVEILHFASANHRKTCRADPYAVIDGPISAPDPSIRATGLLICAPDPPIHATSLPICALDPPIRATGLPICAPDPPIHATGIPIFQTGHPRLPT